MSYNEALKDGIRFERRGYCNMYFPPCHICGQETESMTYIPENKYTCKKCKQEIYLSDRKSSAENSLEAKEKRLEKAIERIKRKTGNFSRYKDAIEVVKKNLHKDGWFQSTEEVMTAIELVKNNVRARHQVKFGRYKADFVLPDEKAVLEIDGELFHTDKTRKKEALRDALIVASLGSDWEVIRITDSLINQNITRLVPAIKKGLKERRRLREQYNGQLPQGYSKKAI